jgi:hypothetical protein
MARQASEANQFSEAIQIWDELKQAIAASSGFQRWQLEQISLDTQQENPSQDQQVRGYLRQTLETLAY